MFMFWFAAFLFFSTSLVHSVSEAVKDHVTKKLERAKVIPNSMVAQAAQTASELFASPKYVAQTLSDRICKRIPEELKKKGIDARMEEVFRENTFAVLQLRLVHVDPLVLAAAWTGAGLSCFLDCIGASNRKIFEEEYRECSFSFFILTLYRKTANKSTRSCDFLWLIYVPLPFVICIFYLSIFDFQ